MNLPRNHHYIPIFLLQQWNNDGGKLIEYSHKYGKFISKLVGPAGTAFERDLYAFPELPDPEAQHIESVSLNYSDGIAARALAIHLNRPNAPWDAELRSGWSRFIIGLQHRHPDAMKEIRPALVKAWETGSDTSQCEYEKIRKPADPEKFEDYIAKNNPLIPAKARVNLIVKSILDNEKVGTKVNHMRWAVVDVTPSDIDLLLSDRPVLRFNLGKPEGYVTMPISPKKLFIAANEQATLKRLAMARPKDIARKVNRDIVACAALRICSHRAQTLFYQPLYVDEARAHTVLSEHCMRPTLPLGKASRLAAES